MGIMIAFVLAILGIICVLYGVAIMGIGSGTWFFAVWYVVGALLLVAAYVAHFGWWTHVPIALRRFAEVVGALALACFIVLCGMSLSGTAAQGEEGLDYLVVLGAQVRGDQPSTVLRYRLDTAYDYLAANPETKCIVSGGQGANEAYPEADVMARYLEDRGIATERIIVERESKNTTENIENSLAFVDGAHDRIGIVTNGFHVFRGTGIARKKGMQHACGIAAPSDAWAMPNNVVRETFGIAKDLVQGNL